MGESYILKDDLSNFCKNFIKSLREGDANFLHKEKGYKGRLVDIEEFVESKDYLNQKGSIGPVVKYELEQIEKRMDTIREVSPYRVCYRRHGNRHIAATT